MQEENKKIITMSEFFGEIVASPFNQHAIVIIEGKTGTGKSRAAMNIAYETAVYLASVLGGRREDYWTLDNTAIMSKSEVIRVMKSLKPKNIFILDDIGVSWSAREWQKKGNKIMNNIIQTFRSWNCIAILTIPDSENVDKIPRNYAHFKIEMLQQNFKQGFTIGRMIRQVKIHIDNVSLHPYIKQDNIKYVRAVFENPPKEIYEEYEIRRKRIQEEMQKEDLVQLERLFNEQDIESKRTEKEPSPNLVLTQRALAYKDENPSLSDRKVCSIFGLALGTFQYNAKKLNMATD